MRKLIIFGAGYANVVKLIGAINRPKPEWSLLGFIDDTAKFQGQRFLGAPVLGKSGLIGALAAEPDVFFFHNVQGSSASARKAASILDTHTCRIASLVHPGIDRRPDQAGRGFTAFEGCAFGRGTRIGDFVKLRYNCTVGADVSIEDYAFLAAGITIGEGASLGAGCFVDLGARIDAGCLVGTGCYVGAGAHVVDDIPDDMMVAGVPARPAFRSAPTRRASGG